MNRQQLDTANHSLKHAGSAASSRVVIVSPRGRSTDTARQCHGVFRYFAVLVMVLTVIGCASPPVTDDAAPDVPAANKLAEVFGPVPTPTVSSPESIGATAAAATATATATAAAFVPTGPDPRIHLECAPLLPAPEQVLGTGEVDVDVTIDMEPTGRTISPLIYGVAVADTEYIREIGATVNRWGGNQVTRHNWEINASNSGADWYFANVSHGWPSLAPGEAVDSYVRATHAVSATALLTIPTIGYVAKDGDNNTRSHDVPERGGPPLEPGSERILGYDPVANQQRTSVKSFATKKTPFADPPDLTDNAVYQDEWVHHLVKTLGRADEGGLRFYALDNEPDMWGSTHRDIHPVEMGYDALLRMFKEYAGAIKAVDSSAKIVAPEVWGVSSLFYSALDRDDDNFRTHADRRAHGNMPFIPWFLAQANLHDQQVGYRSLDVLSVHNYPQNGVYQGGNDPETNALRLRSTQQLWNPDYTDESWISRTEASELQLIPRLRNWVDSYYPGTMIGITEWNYGADDTVNGALAIADVLGIFGREGLDMATYWTFPKPGSPGASAFKLYGNYDGCGRHFGDQLLTAQSNDEQTLSAYASRDSYTGDILVMTVNKLPNKTVQTNFQIDGIGERPIHVYQFDASDAVVHRVADAKTGDDGFGYTVPAYAATLFVIKL